MKSRYQLIVASILWVLSGSTVSFGGVSENVLFYQEPAKKWVEALPLGNGRLGAMVYGGVIQERIQFNEETLWTGEPHDYSHPGAGQYLEEIRQLLEGGKSREAQDLAGEVFMSLPLKQKSYQPFGDLIINFPGHEPYTQYRRELDLERAVARVNYQVDGATYSRETFVSHPDQAITVRLTADKPGSLNFELFLDSPHFQKSIWTDNDRQTLAVRVADGVLQGKAGLRVFTDGKIIPRHNTIGVSGATVATIYLGAHTSFVNFKDVSGIVKRDINQALKRFGKLDYSRVREQHIDDYQALFGRFKIDFEGNNRAALPTNQRIYAFWKYPQDPQFLALYVQYARYLMISSSRPGGQPANLQGIWNDLLEPPWESKWTTNINAEMNYWPVEMVNLSECHEPLFEFITEASHSGAMVAKTHYNSSGWVLHHNTDIWRGAAPINHASHGIWQTGGAWLCHHLWEHYLFTQDKEFLAKTYPLMKGAATFFVDVLFEDPETGWLISTPSNSPEIGGLVAGPTMDHQIIRSLFTICIAASDILDEDHEFSAVLKHMIPQIAPNQIGRLGQLQEWLEDVDKPEVKHRHVSHLWAVHPGKEINWVDTPDLMKAARQSLAIWARSIYCRLCPMRFPREVFPVFAPAVDLKYRSAGRRGNWSRWRFTPRREPTVRSSVRVKLQAFQLRRERPTFWMAN